MNREESLEWIDIALGSLGRHEMMALIQESLDNFDGEFFETMDGEVDRYTAKNDAATAGRLKEIARTIAALRQNRTEKL